MSYSPPPGQSAYPAAAPGGKPRLRGRTPLRLSIIFFVVAVILFVVGGVVLAKKSLGAVNNFQRVQVSAGTGSVNLNERVVPRVLRGAAARTRPARCPSCRCG